MTVGSRRGLSSTAAVVGGAAWRAALALVPAPPFAAFPPARSASVVVLVPVLFAVAAPGTGVACWSRLAGGPGVHARAGMVVGRVMTAMIERRGR